MKKVIYKLKLKILVDVNTICFLTNATNNIDLFIFTGYENIYKEKYTYLKPCHYISKKKESKLIKNKMIWSQKYNINNTMYSNTCTTEKKATVDKKIHILSTVSVNLKESYNRWWFWTPLGSEQPEHCRLNVMITNQQVPNEDR